MKTKYEKPALDVVQFEINSAIAASCSEDAYYDATEKDNCSKMSDMKDQGYFADKETCAVEYTDDCYFTAASGFTS